MAAQPPQRSPWDDVDEDSNSNTSSGSSSFSQRKPTDPPPNLRNLVKTLQERVQRKKDAKREAERLAAQEARHRQSPFKRPSRTPLVANVSGRESDSSSASMSRSRVTGRENIPTSQSRSEESSRWLEGINQQRESSENSSAGASADPDTAGPSRTAGNQRLPKYSTPMIRQNVIDDDVALPSPILSRRTSDSGRRAAARDRSPESAERHRYLSTDQSEPARIQEPFASSDSNDEVVVESPPLAPSRKGKAKKRPAKKKTNPAPKFPRVDPPARETRSGARASPPVERRTESPQRTAENAPTTSSINTELPVVAVKSVPKPSARTRKSAQRRREESRSPERAPAAAPPLSNDGDSSEEQIPGPSVDPSTTRRSTTVNKRPLSGPLANRNNQAASSSNTSATRGRPPTTRGRSTEASGRPTEARGRPAEARGKSTEARGRPAEAHGRPTEALGIPTEALGRPTEALGRPTQGSSRRKATQPRRDNRRRNILIEIRKLQNSTDLLIPRLPFARVVREVTQGLSSETYRFTQDALVALQTATEAFLTNFFSNMVCAAAHGNRVTIMPKDAILLKQLGCLEL